MNSKIEVIKMIVVRYISCFKPGDAGEEPLLKLLNSWGEIQGRLVDVSCVATPDELKDHLLTIQNPDILVVGGHGHGSLEGFLVRDEPVRWHDLAFLLCGKLPPKCTFVFYSCNGGYPGIAHIFGRTGGPDFVFGPTIQVEGEAMAYATEQILDWKEAGGNKNSAQELVDRVNSWSEFTYLHACDQNFLRVWDENRRRHPAAPRTSRPSGASIPNRKWGQEP